MSDSIAAREARLRRAAARRGLSIAKSRRRDARGGYRIVDPQTDAVVRDGASGAFSLTLEQAEAFLGDPQKTQSVPVENLTAANDE